jgi:hypothetical protein
LYSFINPIGSLSPLLAELERAAAPRAITLRIPGALIALAILIVFRWQISAATGVVYRLDRWTGHAVACDMSYRDCQEIQF